MTDDRANPENKKREKFRFLPEAAAALALVILSIVLLKGDAFAFWTWYLLALLLGLITMPLSGIVFRGFEDKGWFFSKILGIALCGFLEWFLVSVRILRFNTVSCVLVCVLFAAGMYLLSRRSQKTDSRILPWDHLRLILTGELLFLAAFLIWTWLAGMNPQAYGTEKFMDYGFMEAMMRSESLPAVDMWYSQGTINYYYGGQYFAVFLTKLTGSSVTVTYNLMRTFIGGIAFILPCSLVYQMTRTEGARKGRDERSLFSALAGIVAGIAVSFAGNMHYVVYRIVLPLIHRIQGKAADARYWFPDATRYIGFNPDRPDKTIHEFPSYSFVLGDLHAHVVNIIFVLLLLGILYAWSSQTRNDEGDGAEPESRKGWIRKEWIRKEAMMPQILLGALLLGLYRMNNFWDFVIYFVVMGGTVLFTNAARYRDGRKFLVSTLIHSVEMAAVSYAASLPFTLQFRTMVSGVALAKNHSLLHQLAVLWGLPVCVTIMLLVSVILDKTRSREEKGPAGLLRSLTRPDLYAVVLGLCACGLIVIPELVYVRDIYESGNARANTMFKLTYQAYIMFGIVMGYTIWRLLRISAERIYKVLGTLSLVCLLLTAGYFGNAVHSWFIPDITQINYLGLYALGHLEASFPEDAAAVHWLRDNVKGSPVVLEANGDSYSGYERVSSATGLPTVVGWYVHEWLWRSDTDDLNIKTSDVEKIYTSTDLSVVKELLIDYNISYIFVGSTEREKYNDRLNTDLLRSLGRTVFEEPEGGTFIVQVQGTQKGQKEGYS